MTESMALLVPALATALLRFLWQGALLGLLAWFALALLRDARPQARYAVACLALLACALLPAWNLVQALSADTPVVRIALVLGDGGVPMATNESLGFLSSPSPDTLALVVALWAAGVATLSLRMACGLLWVGRLRRRASDDAAGRWQGRIDALAARLGIARHVALRLAQAGDSPVTAGWWRPVVLLPVAVAARMPADLVEALLAHELAHVRRHDYLVNLLQSAVEALLFYHPVVWWLSHRIRIERELVADNLAAAALGDRRRLAVALSELERLAPVPAPLPHFAPAAHGGHLMSRIQQLLRPERRATGAAVLLPVIGVALAGVAFYAHARLAAPDTAAAVAPTAAPYAVAQALPAPDATPGARALPAPDAAPDRNRSAYALVRADRDGITMSGDLDDTDEIRLVRGSIDGDFLWFRRDGKAWVVRDAATLARAREAWAGTDALGERMQALEVRMKPHGARMEALAERMQALDDDNVFESPEARAATERMEALGEQAEALAGRQVALAERMQAATEADYPALERERDVLEREQQALHREMERHGASLQALSARMDAQHEPMEALAREMEAASRPMEAIGEDMEALGERIEREAEAADRQVRRLIDEAYRSGRAEPAPARH